MELPLVVFCALLGLACGSFANVVIYRAPRGQSVVSPPSACPKCNARIRARHNIPVVSWLWLRGSCADCGARIPMQYPLIEALTALLFAVVAMVTGWSWELALLLVLAFFTVVLSVVDFHTRRLPNNIVGPFAVATGVAVLAVVLGSNEPWILVRALIGAAALGLVYFLTFLAWPGGMGFGDVKLAPVLGGTLATFGWSTLVVGGASAFVWGSVVGIGAMVVARRRKGLAIPFGPWMFAGAWTGILVGDIVAQWYLRVTGLT